MNKQTKTITRWLWADKDGGITHNLYSDDEARSGFHNSIKTCYPIKLEWSATQFEVEA